jgi:hypothetical protein
MWRPAGDDVSNSAGIDPQTKRRPLRRRALRDALAEQTVVKSLEDVRSYRAFERTLIESASPQPRSSGWLGTREGSTSRTSKNSPWISNRPVSIALARRSRHNRLASR